MKTETHSKESGRRWPRIRRLLAVAVVFLFIGLLAYGLLSSP